MCRGAVLCPTPSARVQVTSIVSDPTARAASSPPRQPAFAAATANSTMGGGNAQKSATARARNLEKLKPSKGSQLKANAAALSIKCHVCLTQFISTSKENVLKTHQENKHPKSTFEQCFPDFKQEA